MRVSEDDVEFAIESEGDCESEGEFGKSEIMRVRMTDVMND